MSRKKSEERVEVVGKDIRGGPYTKQLKKRDGGNVGG